MSGGNAHEARDFSIDAWASWGAALRSRAAGSEDESHCGAIHESAPTHDQQCSRSEDPYIWRCGCRHSSRLASAPVPVRIPAHVVCCYFMDDSSDGGKVRGDVMLEAVFADVTQQLLHVRNLDDSCAAEGFQRIIGKASFAHIATDH